MQTGLPPTEDSSSDPYPDDPKGVGGWLAFVIVMMMEYNPLMISLNAAAFFGSTENDHPVLLQNPVYSHYKWSTWGAIAVLSVLPPAIRSGKNLSGNPSVGPLPPSGSLAHFPVWSPS